jgi:hypothetical protein
MCTDELLLRLADRDRIASVTWLSQDSRNANMAAAAAEIPANHGLAEEVLGICIGLGVTADGVDQGLGHPRMMPVAWRA